MLLSFDAHVGKKALLIIFKEQSKKQSTVNELTILIPGVGSGLLSIFLSTAV